MDKSIFIKYNNERNDIFQTKLQVFQREDGSRYAVYSALTDKAEQHITDIEANSRALSELFAETRFAVNPYVRIQGGVQREEKQIRTWEEKLDTYLRNAEYEKVFTDIRAYAEEIRKIYHGQKACVNLDLTFSNILDDEKWLVNDSEWCSYEYVPADFLIYRAIHEYLNGSRVERNILKESNIYGAAGVDVSQIETYQSMESELENYIRGDVHTLSQMCDEIGRKTYYRRDIEALLGKQYEFPTVQVFWNRGEGYSEQNSSRIPVEEHNSICRMMIELPTQVKEFRIDPCEETCMLKLHTANELGYDSNVVNKYTTNGVVIGEHTLLFTTNDPQLCFRVEGSITKLYLEYEIQRLSPSMAEVIHVGNEGVQSSEPVHTRKVFFRKRKRNDRR